MASWQNGKSINICLMKWQVGKIASWQNGNLMKLQAHKMANQQNGKLVK